MLARLRLDTSRQAGGCAAVAVSQLVVYLNPVALFAALQAVEARHDDANEAFVESLVASLHTRCRWAVVPGASGNKKEKTSQ